MSTTELTQLELAGPHVEDLTQTLWVSEFFYSLQGEGSRQGRPCAFVRLTGCNLSCRWCDAAYTWKPSVMTQADRKQLSLAEILEQLAGYGVRFVEVTGGEPLLQQATPALLTALCDRGYQAIVDTSGSLSMAGLDPRAVVVLDVKCPSSGQSDRVHWPNLELLRPGVDEVKFVIADRADYDWAVDVCQSEGLWDQQYVIFSPVAPLGWAGDMAAWPSAAELAGWMAHDRSPAVLQLQLHRLLWPSAVRGTEEGRPDVKAR